MYSKTVFLSHASPTLLVEQDQPYRRFLVDLGKQLDPSPFEVIIVSSPHFMTRQRFQVVDTPILRCIQDYYGFPDELYNYCLNAENHLELVKHIFEESVKGGLNVEPTQRWGLDHGAWVPPLIMWGEVKNRMVAVSTDPLNHNADYAFGQAIRTAVDSLGLSALFIASGSPTHRLDLFDFDSKPNPSDPLFDFDRVLIDILENSPQRLLDIRRIAGDAYSRSDPEGGLGPLLTAAGFCGPNLKPKILFHDTPYSGVSVLAAYLN
jgi:aromatic ring-opening dioxygenase catalytic subunit (LigB family)